MIPQMIFRAMGRRQRGSGLGGLFRSAARFLTPHLKKGLKYAGKRALTAGSNMIQDMSDNNTSFKDAFKSQAKNEFVNAKNEIKSLKPINILKGVSSGSSRAKPIAAGRKKRKRKSKVTL